MNISYGSGNYKMDNKIDIWPSIEEDLSYAAANLPPSQDEIGRANHYTAIALLAKAYMFQHKFREAKSCWMKLFQVENMAWINIPIILIRNYKTEGNMFLRPKVQSMTEVWVTIVIWRCIECSLWFFPILLRVFQPTQWLVNHFKTDPRHRLAGTLIISMLWM